MSEGWSFVTLDLRVDTTTPHGKAMARMAGVFGELERDLIAERTKAALAVKKGEGSQDLADHAAHAITRAAPHQLGCMPGGWGGRTSRES